MMVEVEMRESFLTDRKSGFSETNPLVSFEKYRMGRRWWLFKLFIYLPIAEDDL